MPYKLDLVDKINRKIFDYFTKYRKNPELIYLTIEEYSEALKEVAAYEAGMCHPIEKYSSSNILTFRDIPVVVLRDVEFKLADLLTESQLNLLLVDEDEELRSLAHKILKVKYEI